MLRVIQFIQNLSLDVTAGAVISSLFMAKIFQVDLSVSMLIGLAVAIWLIYTVDHLMDARKSTQTSTNKRHEFHKRNRNLLTGLAAIVFLIGLVNLMYLPRQTIYMGLGLACLVGVYLGTLHVLNLSRTWHKEVLAAVIYTVGVFVAPLSLIDVYKIHQWLVFIEFFLIVFANLMIFPLFEYQNDSADGIHSIATLGGKRFVKALAYFILVLNFGLLIYGWVSHNKPIWNTSQLVFFGMNLTLFILLPFETYFQKHDRYRLLGDGIFFIPLLGLLM